MSAFLELEGKLSNELERQKLACVLKVLPSENNVNIMLRVVTHSTQPNVGLHTATAKKYR